MDREQLCDSLIEWLQTFHVDAPHTTEEDLSDGVAMAQVLHQIDPEYFNETWMSKIKTDDVTNWRLKVNNLKKILKGILEYNLEVLGIQIHDFQMPDVNAIGEHISATELGRLLQLILGCAVNCNEKQEYIQRIMAMEESVQHVVMTAIQELMTKEMTTGEGDSETGEQLRRTVEELNGALAAKEELMQRCHELDLQVTALLDEKQVMHMENERLLERLNQAENLDDPGTAGGKRFLQLQNQLEQLQEEVFKLEAGKDDFRIRYEVMFKECSDLKDKNSEMTALVEENRNLRDELDVSRHSSEQVAKYEAIIENYKKKMEELSDLRGQVKLLEDKNTKYMQEHLELEEELRKSNTVKQQLEVYKRQVHEVQNKLTEETKRADKADFEAKRATEKMATLQREKERVAAERDSLKEVNEELKCTQLMTVESNSENKEGPSLEMLSLPSVIREKLVRLEHENKMLKLRNEGSEEESSQVLQTMLDDVKVHKNELETELRLANQKILELEAQVEDLQENQKSSVSSSELVELNKKLKEQIKENQQKDILIQRGSESRLDLEHKLKTAETEKQGLQEQLHKKEDEMRSMEERYKKYLEKAKAVIKSLDANRNPGNFPEIQVLKNQIQEKERKIEQLEKELDKTKQEGKLITTAFTRLGMQLQRQGVEERLANSSGQSFLARQRQVHTRRPQAIPNTHTSAPR
ncbi:hypothetical protein ACJMK2_042202 [Sinanodonta woodiana]|uniref:Protein Hook homolog 3 n=1 Tax=Sinanodonta woodiana TaxID=1069815 RepID=A0ABD3W6N5_SINWO